MTEVVAAVVPIAEMLDSLGIGACAFDDAEQTVLWNSSFLRLFPEHAGHVHAGEPYTANLRRFYLARLDATELPHIDRYIADGIARHRSQFQPFEFCHREQWVRVASLPVPGLGRLRVWTPIAPPHDGETLARVLADSGKETALGAIDDIADGLMLRDAQGLILRVNRRFAAMYRLESEAHAIGNRFERVLADTWEDLPGSDEATRAFSDNARFAGAPFELPLPEDRWVRMSEHRAPDGSGVSTHVDITEMHRLLRASADAHAHSEALAASLRQQIEERKRAEAALNQVLRVEAVGQLTSGVAHDFNNLLSVMLGNVELLELDETDPARLRRLEVVRGAAERGRALTGQLLAFARRQPLVPRPVALAAMVTDMLPLLRSACGVQIDIVTDLPAAVPAALVDATQLELVILNLAINARDAMPAGGRLRITTRLTKLRASSDPDAPVPGEYVELSVTDTGTGMSEAVRARAFEPFFTTKGPGAGSGLGLSQAYGVARQSGGTVQIDSTPGHGTTVRVLLPGVTDPAPALPPTSRPPASSAACRILLVDDDVLVLESFHQILDRLGYKVTAVSGAAAAQAAIEGGLAIDVLITDVRMPGMTGPELANWVWQRLRGLPVLFISGFAAPEIVESFGPNCRLLRKPCRLAELRAAISDLMTGACLRS